MFIMNVFTLPMTTHLFWTSSKYMCPLSIDENMCNLWLFFIFLFMDVPWQITKTWKIYFSFWRSRMSPINIGLTHHGGGWQKSCMLYCWRLPKQHLLLPPSLWSMLMKSPWLITHNGCQSINMWCKNGSVFPSSYVLKNKFVCLW